MTKKEIKRHIRDCEDCITRYHAEYPVDTEVLLRYWKDQLYNYDKLKEEL